MIARLIGRSSAREALRRGLAFYLTLLICAFILFAGSNGLDASSVTRTARQSFFARWGLLGIWLVSTLPAIRPLLRDPRVQFLKSQPVPEADVVCIIAGYLIVAESPWIALWVRGAPAAAAASASLSAVALHTLWLARPWRRHHRVLFWASALAWSWAPPMLALPVALTSASVGIVAAWRRGLEEAGDVNVWPLRGPVWVALALAHIATLVRAHGSILLRCAFACAVGARLTYFAAHNQEIDQFPSVAAMTTAVFVVVVLIGLGALVGPLLRAERTADWVLVGASVSSAERQWSTAFALALLAWLSVPVFGGFVLVGLGLDASQAIDLLLSLAGASLPLAVGLERVARAALRDTGRDSSRLMLGVTVVAAAFIACLFSAGRWLAIGAWSCGAFALLLRTRPAHNDSERPGVATGVEGDCMLTVENVAKCLGSRQVLKGVNLTIGGGQSVLVHGQNGAGKSTLLRIVVGLLRPDAGVLTLCGAGLTRESVRYKAALGFVPDTLDVFPELLTAEYVQLVQSLKRSRAHSLELPADLSERLGVADVWRQRLSALSFGQRKRLGVLVALIGDPFLLVLDEPSNGLDPSGVDLMVDLIAERTGRGQATLCSSNDGAFAARLRATELWLRDGYLELGMPAASP